MPQQQHRIANPFVRSGARKAMSITQTYFLSRKARVKLSREQERWFNQSVRSAGSIKTTPPPPAHRMQWADRVDEDEADSDFDVDDAVVVASALRHQAPAVLGLDEDMGDDDLEDDYAQLELVRTHSHADSPPDLIDHNSDSSDDGPMPPSPADAELLYSEAEAKESQPDEDALYQDKAYYAPRRSPAGLVSAISVY